MSAEERQSDPRTVTAGDHGAEPESLVVALETGDRIHYLDWGRTGEPVPDRPALPPVLLLHGLAQTVWSWAPVARRLRERTTVVAADLRGHGLSDAPRTAYDLESLAFDMLTVMSACGWGRDVGGPPAAIAGHGLGALVGATMAVLRPASVAAVALIDAGWEELEEATGQTVAEFERAIGDPPEVLRSMADYLADRRGYDPATWDADQERAARAAVDEKHVGHVAPVARGFVLRACVEAMFSYRPAATLPLVGAPLLVAVAESGSADDDLARERRLALDDTVRARAAARAPATRVVRFPGAGHNLMRYRPVELTAALLDLLVEVTAGGPTSGRTPGDPA